MASQNDLDPSSHLATSLDRGDVLVYAGNNSGHTLAGIETVLLASDAGGFPDPQAALEDLANRGITSVLVEAGGTMIASLLKAGLVDRLIWTRSAGLIGGDGLASLATLGLEDLADGRIFKRVSTRFIDDDVVEIFNAA